MSGASALSTWALDKNPLAKTIPIAYQLNCTMSPAVRLLDLQETKDLVACLKRTSLENLLQVQLLSTWFVPSFGPVIDQSTLNAKNLDLLDSSTSPATFSDETDVDGDMKHVWNVVNISSSSEAGRQWRNLKTESIGQPVTARGQMKTDKSLIDRRRLQSAALIFDNIPLIVGFPSLDPCAFNFPRSMYDLFHVYSNRSALLGGSNFQDRQHYIHQIFFPPKSKANASSSANDSRTPALTSKIVRFLRTFTQNLFSYHRQKIYDVLLYHYRNWESRSNRENKIDNIDIHNNNDNKSDDDDVDTGRGSDIFNVEQLLVDGLYLSPLLRMLKARVSPSSGQQNPVWVYNLEDQSSTPGNWFSGSDYYEDQPARIQQSESCFNFETLDSNSIITDVRSNPRSDESRGGKVGDVEDGRLIRAVLDLHLSYSFGLEMSHEAIRQTSAFRNGRRLWMERLINFIHTGNPNMEFMKPSIGDVIMTEEKLFWPEFEPEKQSYLSIGDKIEVKRHFRSSKMSLWLDLIPRIHRSDNLSEQHHQLDNFDDLRTFASSGLDVAEYNRLVRIYSQRYLSRETEAPANITSTVESDREAANLIPFTPEPHMSDDSSFAKRDSQLLLLEHTNSKRSTTTHNINVTSSGQLIILSTNSSSRHEEDRNKRRNSDQNAFRNGGPSSGNSEKEANSDEDSFAMTTFKGIAQVPLGITVGVGCVLLLLNVIVFAAVFYQKSKARRCLEKRQRETSCCRHVEAPGGVKYESSPEKSGKEGRYFNHRRGCSDETSFYQSQKPFQCTISNTTTSRCANRNCDQSEKFSEFERLSYTGSAENCAYPESDQQPLATVVPPKETKELSTLLKSSAIIGTENRSGSISSTSGSVGSKHYPVPPPPPATQRPGCHHPLQMHPNHQQLHHISGVFDKPQQQLLTKDVKKFQQQVKIHPNQNHLETSRLVNPQTNPSTNATTTTNSKTSSIVASLIASNKIDTSSIRPPSWKSPNVDDSCYEEALFNELSKLELDNYDNDTSTLV